MDVVIGCFIGAAMMGVLWLFERGNYLAEKRRSAALQQRINYILGHTEDCPDDEPDTYGKETPL